MLCYSIRTVKPESIQTHDSETDARSESYTSSTEMDPRENLSEKGSYPMAHIRGANSARERWDIGEPDMKMTTCEKCGTLTETANLTLIRVRYIWAPHGGVEEWCARCANE